jgi:hypothetical protein
MSRLSQEKDQPTDHSPLGVRAYLSVTPAKRTLTIKIISGVKSGVKIYSTKNHQT